MTLVRELVLKCIDQRLSIDGTKTRLTCYPFSGGVPEKKIHLTFHGKLPDIPPGPIHYVAKETPRLLWVVLEQTLHIDGNVRLAEEGELKYDFAEGYEVEAEAVGWLRQNLDGYRETPLKPVSSQR